MCITSLDNNYPDITLFSSSMETKRISITRHAFVVLLIWAAAAALFTQNLVTRASSELISFEDQKNFFNYPDPNARSPPTVSYITPTPPAPAHTPTHIGGTPTTTTCPSGGSSQYHHPPPPPHIAAPVVVIPTTPPHIIVPPPPPFSFDPNSPPFPCKYWKNHPELIWGVFGWWGSVGSAFGVSSSLPISGSDHMMNLLQALSNKQSDGIGELYRQGTAALLNSMAAPAKFPFTTAQVRDGFVTALGSDKAAAAQAQLFKLANEGKRA